MSRKNYDSKAMAVFDLIGSYFVDIVYNNHYRISKDLVNRGVVGNLTDAYRTTVINYMNGSSRDDLFKIIVHKLHEYYQTTSGFGAILISEFQNKVLSQFIPPEYYRDFADKHKDKTLKEIIVRTVNEFGDVVLSVDMLRQIIDNHSNYDNVIRLQDHIIEIFIQQREEFYAKFAAEISKKNAGGTVDKSIFNKLKKEYIAEKHKCCELMAEKERAANIIEQLLNKITALENEIVTLRHMEPAQVPPKRTQSGKTPYPSPPRSRAPRDSVDAASASHKNVPFHERHINSNTNASGGAGNRAGDVNNEASSGANAVNSGAKQVKSALPNTPSKPEPPKTTSKTSEPSDTDELIFHDMSALELGIDDSNLGAPDNTLDDEDSGLDDEEIHRRQRAAIMSRTTAAPKQQTLSLDDDPWSLND